jgi:hypothetical protein
MRVSDRLRVAFQSRAEPSSPRLEAVRLARGIVEKGGASVQAVVFFGSRKTQAQPDSFSAYDFFVLTHDYRRFYEGLRRTGVLKRNPTLVAALNSVLPPNQISIVDAADGTWIKCSVATLGAFMRDTSSRRKDHFCLGRLFQPTEILYVSEPAIREAVEEALLSAHLLTYRWIRPWLPSRFGVEQYARTLLRVSLSREIRPEPPGRMEELFVAQRDYFVAVYGELLRDLAQEGELRELGGGEYALVHPAGAFERLKTAAYFRWSLVRATARWAKYIVTYEGWLDYIVRKVERRTGAKIVLTQRERRHPLIFLWPRLIRFLRDKDV